MNKNVAILCCVVAGIAVELILFYVWSAFEDETHLIVGCTCGLAGCIAFMALCGVMAEKSKQSKGLPTKGERIPLYVLIVSLSVALTGLLLYAKDIKDREAKRIEPQAYCNMREKAMSVLEQAELHDLDARLLADYISGINYSDVARSGMSSTLDKYNAIAGINGYFNNIEYARRYYNDGRYQLCIDYANSAIDIYIKANDAYILGRSILDYYR